MRPSTIRARMREGRKAHGLTLTFRCEAIVEMAGLAGFDYVHADAEHGVFDYPDIESMCRAAEANGMICTARVPNIEPSTLLRFYDRGVMGILAPHVSTAAEAEQAARCSRFAPEGDRSFGTGRGRDYGLGKPPPEYMAEFNREVTVGIQIETAEAVANIEEILEVPGVDFITFGPADLAQSMGHPGYPDHPEVQAAMQQVTDTVHARGRLMQSDVMDGPNLVQWLGPKLREYIAEANA